MNTSEELWHCTRILFLTHDDGNSHGLIKNLKNKGVQKYKSTLFQEYKSTLLQEYKRTLLQDYKSKNTTSLRVQDWNCKVVQG